MGRRFARHRRPRRTARAVIGVLGVLVLLGAVNWVLKGHPTPIASTPPPSSPPPAAPASAAPTAATPQTPSPTPPPIPDPAALRAHLAPALARLAGEGLGFVVADAPTGRVLFDDGGDEPAAPASTAKIATAVAALTVLGADHRFETSTVLRGSQVILVGGGDPALAGPVPPALRSAAPSNRAQLTDLVSRTAEALRARGLTRVSVGYDAHLFVGPAVASGWTPVYLTEGDVSRVSALMIDEGRVAPTSAAREADPASAAARDFATLLAGEGITVTGGPVPVAANSADHLLAKVSSPTVAELIADMLGPSDNDIAEALGRQIALARGLPASFDGAVRAIRDVLAALGIDTGGFVMADASGLSTLDRLRPQMLVQLLRLVLTDDRYQPVREALPVAGVSGTLATRFTAPAAAPGVGVVHAKTGTLAHVVALAGYARDDDGRLLVFAAIADRVPPPQLHSAESALDVLVAGVVTCGCS
ncbi:MAG: D-alanyl-D-alanine carboxypeptidase/D-alanyl-D-alanine-endopeptidase [Acidothermus sp.]|nr:D-alanyl-D-alanine carboxypeptidase/D-alanyl-D-alanine-endopeptidase [Acidothermus sp.]